VKLTLTPLEGVDVLTGSGEISSNDVLVLKAGIKKLFLSGKNRIVLELPEAGKIPVDVLREVAQLDIIARELSGRVVLAGVKPDTKAQIGRFGSPPIIECFDLKEDAIRFFNPPPRTNALKLPPVVEVKAAAPSTAAELEAKAKAAQQYKADIRQKEITDLGALRKLVSQLENENKLLKGQLLTMLNQRVNPPNETSYQTKIRALESRIEELFGEAAPKA